MTFSSSYLVVVQRCYMLWPFHDRMRQLREMGKVAELENEVEEFVVEASEAIVAEVETMACKVVATDYELGSILAAEVKIEVEFLGKTEVKVEVEFVCKTEELQVQGDLHVEI